MYMLLMLIPKKLKIVVVLHVLGVIVVVLIFAAPVDGLGISFAIHLMFYVTLQPVVLIIKLQENLYMSVVGLKNEYNMIEI
jgi:hypothetical protein